jgi:dolichyl-diphosphooligosaccharide--protein glycosyltransferase
MSSKLTSNNHVITSKITNFDLGCRRKETEVKLPNISREAVINGLKNLGKLRVKISRTSVLTFTALILIMFVAYTIRILPLRWEIGTGTGFINLSEFDAFFEFRIGNYMVQNGLLSPFWPKLWLDTQLWYPQGISMGSESLPSAPMTGAFLYDLIHALGVNIDFMSFCALLPPMFGTLCVLIMYFIGKEYGGKAVGMLAALILALDASFITRSNLGWFETEIATFSFLLFFLLFPKAIEEERPIGSSLKLSLVCGACLAYFIMGWGAAYYLVDLTVLFVFVLLLLRRYTRRILFAYSITYGLGLLVAMSAPFLGIKYPISYAVLPAAGLFLLLCLSEVLQILTSARERFALVVATLVAIIGAFTAIFALGYAGNIAGKFLTVLNPLLRSASPLTLSVAEHNITAWGSMYYDLGILILFFVVGLYFISRNLVNKNLFLLLFGLTSLYFAGSMVRLLYLLAPAFGLIAAVGIVGILRPFITMLKEPPKITTKKFRLEHVGKEFSGTAVFLIFLILMTQFAFSPQSGGIPDVYRQAYTPLTITAASLPIVPNAAVTEWLDMLTWTKNNLAPTDVVDAWWDYGFWLTILGNVTTLNDNATINGTQIENVGFTMMANETESVKMLKLYNAKYILVFTTLGLQTPSGSSTTYALEAGYGDEGKWTWMARISGQSAHRTGAGNATIWPGWNWTDETAFGQYTNVTTYWPNNWLWNDRGYNTTIYQLMTWARTLYCSRQGVVDPDGGNATGGVNPDTGETNPVPQYFEPAYIAGLTLAPSDASSLYGNLVPLVALYKIDYPDG